MNIQEAKKIIEMAALVNDSVLIEGPHGIGKSQIVEQFAKENDFYFYPLFLSHQEVGDIIGIPKDEIVNGESVTVWTVPIWLQRMREAAASGKRCILFLDEINRAPLDVRQSALQLVLEGKIHEHELPSTNGFKTLIVSAINPASDYQVDELDPALYDRFTHITVEPHTETFLAYAKTVNLNNVVCDFLAEFSDRLHITKADGTRGPTPRSWIKLGEYIDNADSIPPEIMYNIIAGRIGKEIGGQFFSYLKNYVNVIKTDDIIDYVEENKDEYKKIEDLAEGLSEIMKKSEAIQKTEMSYKLCEIYKTEEDMFPFLTYLYSLEIEIVVAFLKKMRAEDSETYAKIAQYDGKINKKELFKRIVQASERS